jgi:membrane protein implicated in regulation of membrane protease activity
MSGFGWNFYGFFVFAAVWLVVYFSWARWMTKHERKASERDQRDPRATR